MTDTGSRLRTLFAILLTLAMALGSYWALTVIRRGIENANAEAQRTDPDYFVENFNFVRASMVGQARYAV